MGQHSVTIHVSFDTDDYSFQVSRYLVFRAQEESNRGVSESQLVRKSMLVRALDVHYVPGLEFGGLALKFANHLMDMDRSIGLMNEGSDIKKIDCGFGY